MSAKNKFQNKKLRKLERSSEDSAWENFERVPVSQFPRTAAVSVLANGKNKSTSARRKRIKRALSFTISVPRIQSKDSAAKLTMDLQRMPMHRLVRTIQKSARHAATCRYLAEKCETESIKKNMLAVQTFHLGVLKQARAEYQVRTT